MRCLPSNLLSKESNQLVLARLRTRNISDVGTNVLSRTISPSKRDDDKAPVSLVWDNNFESITVDDAFDDDDDDDEDADDDVDDDGVAVVVAAVDDDPTVELFEDD